MKKEKYLELEIKLLFQLKKYLMQDEMNSTTFYHINQLNYNHMKKSLQKLTNEQINFLELYFSNVDVTEKIKMSGCKSKNDYYYRYRQIIRKIKKE